MSYSNRKWASLRAQKSEEIEQRLKHLRLQILEAESLLKLVDDGNVIHKTEGGWEIQFKTFCEF